LHLVFSAPETEAEQRAASAAMLENEVDWVITDCGGDQVPADAAVVLAVCGPESRSVRNASALQRLVREQAGESRLFFLLNSFDSGNAFHRRMRERLAAEAGSSLLPFAICPADELGEALSEGKTIFEFAPDAAVTGDFMRLVCWLGDFCQTTFCPTAEVA
jgi:cellulose biosynthesis protein BcsQ